MAEQAVMLEKPLRPEMNKNFLNEWEEWGKLIKG